MKDDDPRTTILEAWDKARACAFRNLLTRVSTRGAEPPCQPPTA